MLDMAFGLTDTSRLGCQVRLTKELDGITCTLPSATRNMFVDGTCHKIGMTQLLLTYGYREKAYPPLGNSDSIPISNIFVSHSMVWLNHVYSQSVLTTLYGQGDHVTIKGRQT